MVALFLVAPIVVLSGCSQDQPAPKKDVNKELNGLYQAYLSGGRDDARQSLQAAIHLVQTGEMHPDDEAWGLWLGYARLYALERRAGSNELAQVDLIKARYWYLRVLELSGDTPPKTLASVKKSAAADKVVAFVDEWDKKHTDGKGPRYVHQP